MTVYKDKARSTWVVSARFRDPLGTPRRTTKRGFESEADALEWERRLRLGGDCSSLTLSEFFEVYERDIRPTVTQSTWANKELLFRGKVEPYLGAKPVGELAACDILHWQDLMRHAEKSGGGRYSQTYLRALNNQLNAILNHAVRFYGIGRNPMLGIRRMGAKDAGEMVFWTKAEYLSFSRFAEENPMVHCAFEVLYWCGLRVGEMLALTPADIDFGRGAIMVRKSLSRVDGRYVATAPKTSCSRRVVQMPPFLEDELAALVELQGTGAGERVFDTTKASLRRWMDKGVQLAGLPKIRIHDLRHSHVSLLIDLGFPAVAIAERMGHTSITVTYRYAHLFPTRQTEMASRLEDEGCVR